MIATIDWLDTVKSILSLAFRAKQSSSKQWKLYFGKVCCNIGDSKSLPSIVSIVFHIRLAAGKQTRDPGRYFRPQSFDVWSDEVFRRQLPLWPSNWAVWKVAQEGPGSRRFASRVLHRCKWRDQGGQGFVRGSQASTDELSIASRPSRFP